MNTSENKKEAMIIIKGLLDAIDDHIEQDGKLARISCNAVKKHLQEAYEFLEKD